MKNSKPFLVMFLSLVLLISCKDKSNYSKINNSETIKSSNSHKIIINEVVDGGSYAYIKVKENENEYWMAIPNSNIVVGETYYYNGGMVMKNFESKQLNKIFDRIIFAEGIRQTEQVEVKNENPHAKTAQKPQIITKLDKSEGELYLEELFNKKNNFSGKEVEVKGIVVKVNKSILDRNWIHVIDGTKTSENSSLTITTSELAKVGDTITVKGIIILNKDFGHGYVYDILLEEGKIVQ